MEMVIDQSTTLSFLRYYKLNNDTIFIGDSAVAVIYETEKSYFGDDNEIHIKSIATNENGIYHDLGAVKPKN